MRFKALIIAFAILLPNSGFGQEHQLGIGLASSYDGRFVPAISGLYSFANGFAVSGSSAGVATKAYYHNSYTLSALKLLPMGAVWFGDIDVGYGLGSHIGIKELDQDPAGDGESSKNGDFDIGPAFRININPFWRVYVAFDYVMGLGFGALGLGFADTGTISIGATF